MTRRRRSFRIIPRPSRPRRRRSVLARLIAPNHRRRRGGLLSRFLHAVMTPTVPYLTWDGKVKRPRYPF